jgi:hypothetical protein
MRALRTSIEGTMGLKEGPPASSQVARSGFRLRQETSDLRDTTAAIGAGTESGADLLGRPIAGDGGLGDAVCPDLKAHADDRTFVDEALGRTTGQQGAAFNNGDLVAIKLQFQPFEGRQLRIGCDKHDGLEPTTAVDRGTIDAGGLIDQAHVLSFG